MASAPISVLVVSIHAVVRAGVEAVITDFPDIEVLACPAATASLSDIDVALYDVIGLASGHLDLDLLLQQPRLVVLALCHDDRPELTNQAIGRGAHGLVSLNWPAAKVVAAVRSSVIAEPTLEPDWVDPALAAVGLTPRELDVLRLIAAGRSNQEVAQQLYLSVNSVKTHIRSAYRRISVKSRSQAVIWCLEHGIGGANDTTTSTPV